MCYRRAVLRPCDRRVLVVEVVALFQVVQQRSRSLIDDGDQHLSLLSSPLVHQKKARRTTSHTLRRLSSDTAAKYSCELESTCILREKRYPDLRSWLNLDETTTATGADGPMDWCAALHLRTTFEPHSSIRSSNVVGIHVKTSKCFNNPY